MFLNGGAGKDTLTGGTDADTLYGNGGDDKLTGNGGDDVLTGGVGNDTALGGDGDDYLMGDAGNDRLDGGAGSDWAGYESANAAVKVDLSLTTAQNTGGGGTDTLLNIENLYGTSYADTLTGSSANNMLFGGAGNDTIFGAAGDDFLAGGAGNDTLSGGDGDDTVSYDDGDATGVVVNLATGVATGHGTDTLVSIEGVYGSAGNDTLLGSDRTEYLGGGAGDDLLRPGAGANYVEGGAGNDTLSFDDGIANSVIVYLATGEAQGHGERYTTHFTSIENIEGSSVIDNIYGDGANNRLSGNGGDDMLVSGGGNDTLVGGEGDDYLVVNGAGEKLLQGGAGMDTADFGSIRTGENAPGIVIDLASTSGHTVAPGITVSLSSVEGVYGTVGNDTIYASEDYNHYTGGGGADRYVFRTLDSIGHGADGDFIFLNPNDTVILDLSNLDADITQAGRQAFHFVGTSDNPYQFFSGHAGEVMFTSDVSGRYRVDFDVDGDAHADATLWLNGLSVWITESNFIF